MVAVLALAFGMPAHAQHEPIPDVMDCPIVEIKEWTWPFTALPAYNAIVLGDPVNFAPARGFYDFCAYADMVFCSLAPLGAILPEAGDFADLVQCMLMDINGPLDPEAEIPVTGNGIPDAQFELGIMAQVLNTPSHPLHQATSTAFEANYQYVKDLVMEAIASVIDPPLLPGGTTNLILINTLAPFLIPSLSGLLAAAATMGDETTNDSLDQLIELLADIGLDPPEGGIGAVTLSVPALGPFGDADNNGLTNWQTYWYFVDILGYNAPQYVAAALDPNAHIITLTGYSRDVSLGADINIMVDVALDAVSFEWEKDGVPDDNDTGFLVIPNAQVEDSGWYRVTVGFNWPSDEKQEGLDYAWKEFEIVVGEVHDVPAAGMFGLLLLAGACAAAGVAGIRRRK